MNSVQKQIINMYCKLQRNAYIVLFGEDLVANIDEYTSVDTLILNELLDERFIKDMREHKEEIDQGLVIEEEIFDLESDEKVGYITRYSNFKRMNMPKEFIKKRRIYQLLKKNSIILSFII